jgi:putative ABC transport system ATP-binding protein
VEHNILIATEQLCRYYRRGHHEIRAVDTVNLSVRRGEFVALVGASGSGKSTLLNLLAGLDTPTSGRVLVESTRLNDLSRKELAAYRARRVGMVFQSFNLLPHQTALRNVELALFFDGTPAADRTRRARRMLERLGLHERLDHRPADLSGGEQQRVALARALVKEPAVLFADEPTGNLDRENSRQVSDLLTSLHRQGLTIIMATHDPDLAARGADRTIRLHYGRLTEEVA